MPEPSLEPVLIAETVKDELASASESELELELVSKTSPVCSPVISTKLYGLESEKDKTAFELARARASSNAVLSFSLSSPYSFVDITGEHTGDVLDTSSSSNSDSDADASSSLTVSAIRTGSSEGSGTSGSVGSALTGTYGQLTIAANGSYTYVANQSADWFAT